jgi:hypothetical protein
VSEVPMDEEEERKKKYKTKAKGQNVRRKRKKNSNVISNVTEKTFITCPVERIYVAVYC